jgi:4-alpha-glucanotransferase
VLAHGSRPARELRGRRATGRLSRGRIGQAVASMDLPRSSGVQLHLTSLPGGRLGPRAHEWIDWLAEAGQTWWQMLPLGPPDRHGSPYKSRSAFAAWGGLLAEPDAEVGRDEREDFLERHGYWTRPPRAQLPRPLLDDQVRFEREWSALRAHAERRGVKLIGDVPIYVAPGSIDHRAWPEMFRDDAVAGVPPDAYAETGQLWGNPLYDWPALRRRRYRWWTERLRRTFELFDMTRVDHFRGFVAYWAVPKGQRTALNGRWQRGPGRAVFDAARRELGELPVIAEDLGDITPAVTRLRTELGFPGMVVLQFAFDPEDPDGIHELHMHEEHSAAYAGTHDSDTVVGYLAALDGARRERLAAALPDDDEEHWAFIRMTFSSRARLAMIQGQDILGLGSEARMNTPGRAKGNWTWRLPEGGLDERLAARLRAASEEAGRLAG